MAGWEQGLVWVPWEGEEEEVVNLGPGEEVVGVVSLREGVGEGRESLQLQLAPEVLRPLVQLPVFRTSRWTQLPSVYWLCAC